MPFIYNASSREVGVRVHGAHFTFGPKQVKTIIDPTKGAHMVDKFAYEGLVSLPDQWEDLDYRESPEGKKALKDAEARGIQNRIAHLERLKQNEIVSLQRDIDRGGMKYDARLEMSDQMMAQMEELAQYKSKSQDEQQKKLDRVKALEKLIDKE